MGKELTESIIVNVVGNVVMLSIFWLITHGIKNWIHEMITTEINNLTLKLDKISEIAIYNKTNNQFLKKEITEMDHRTRKLLNKISGLKCMKEVDCENIS